MARRLNSSCHRLVSTQFLDVEAESTRDRQSVSFNIDPVYRLNQTITLRPGPDAAEAAMVRHLDRSAVLNAHHG